MIIGEFSKHNVPVIAPDTTLRDAAVALRNADSPVLVVAREGQLIGSLCARDLAFKGCGDGRNPDTATVSEVYDRNPVVCQADMRLSSALALMARHRQSWLLVLGDDRQVVGSTSFSALLEFLADLVPEESNGPEPEYVRRVRGDSIPG